MDPSDGSVWSNSCLDEGKSELLHFDPEGTLLGRYATPEPGNTASMIWLCFLRERFS